MNRELTTVVAGLGRCGSSLVMQMLHAAGIEATGKHPAFEDAYSQRFPSEFKGQAVKVLHPHILDVDLSGCRVTGAIPVAGE